jgi:hypothetical protein
MHQTMPVQVIERGGEGCADRQTFVIGQAPAALQF